MKFKLVPDIHALYEMARVGIFDDMEVLVWTDDPGKIPHFHIRDASTKGEKFNCCVRIDKAEYFKHTGKEDNLNSKDKKDLVDFLQSNHSRSDKTYWQYLVMLWNDNNSDVEISEDQEMPNYREL